MVFVSNDASEVATSYDDLTQCFSTFLNPCPLLINIKISHPPSNLSSQIILFEI
jgi:hypothetical protein